MLEHQILSTGYKLSHKESNFAKVSAKIHILLTNSTTRKLKEIHTNN